MTFLPIVERELREGARKNSVRYVRLTVAAVALVISLFQLAIMPIMMGMGRTSGSAGFGFMTGYAFVLCLLAGIFVTADCLSEEKREGTLGLLFLTDLRGYDVVLGKLASQLVYLGYALLAIIPAAALPLLFGGVTGGELWRISLALVNLLFFALATGMFASTFCRQAGFAMALTGGSLAVFCLGVPAAQGLLNLTGGTSGAWFGWLSPAQPYARAMESAFLSAPGRYWLALGGSHLIGWLFIALACWRLPRSWQDQPQRAVKPDTLIAHWAGNSRAARTRRRRELLDQDPWLWLIGESKGTKTMLLVITAIWAGAVLISAIADVQAASGILFGGGYVYLFVVKILFATQACRFFVETRRAGSFEMLLATPIDLDRLVAAQWVALRRTFGPALITAGIVCAVYFVMLLISEFNVRSGGNRVVGDLVSVSVVFGTLGLLVQFLDFIALGYLGMWLALTMRKPHLAPGATILFVLLLPLIGLWCVGFIGFVLDIILIAVFSSKLRTEVRQVLLQQAARSSSVVSPAPTA